MAEGHRRDVVTAACGAALGGPSRRPRVSLYLGLPLLDAPALLCPEPQLTVGLMAVKDGPEFRQVLHKIVGKGGEGWQVGERLDALGPVSASLGQGSHFRGRETEPPDRSSATRSGKRQRRQAPGPEPWVRCPTSEPPLPSSTRKLRVVVRQVWVSVSSFPFPWLCDMRQKI